MKSPNFYADLGLDRRAERRRDPAWLAARLLAPSARVVPVWKTRNFIRPGERPAALFLPPATIETSVETAIFLGENGEAAYFALDVSMPAEEDLPRFADGVGNFVDLRAVGAIIDRREGALLAYARGLVHWHSRHQYCGVCGSRTRSEAGGHIRACANPNCGTQHFPRTDPAVIMLVTHEDRCFLGRQKIWPPGMRSTLAGFVEPGESLEEAVARELYEEAGIACLDVRYHSSQPWPFPSSIMLGFTARAAALDYRIDPNELETGEWYSRDFLRQTHDLEVFRLPRLDSIARRLIEDWLAHG